MSYKSKNNKTALIIIIALFFILQTMNPLLWWPKQANAQTPATTEGQASQMIQSTTQKTEEKTEKVTEKAKETVGQKIFKGMILTAAVTLRNTLIMMSKRAAEQTVTYISTGSAGQGPMFWTEAIGTFKENLTYYIIGQFLDNLNAMFGIDICNPATPEFEFGLKLGLQFSWLKDPQLDKLKKPNCDLQKLSRNWGALIDGIKKKYKMIEGYTASPYKQAYMTVAVLNEVFDVSFSPQKSDFGMKMMIEDKAREEEKKKREAEEAQRREGEGMKGITSPGGEYIKTPASFTKSHSESELEKAKATGVQEVETSKDVLTSIPGSVALAFLNTFVSKMWTDYILKKFFEQGLANPTASFNPIQKTFDTQQNLQKEFALQKLNLTFAQKQIDLLSEYSTCLEFRGLNNCVMDTSFADAVRRATQDKPYTVQGAIDDGLLKSDEPFISSLDGRNKSDDCYEIGYCYSNLVKLRRARIIPIGWEIAANLVDSGSNISLNDMIAAFNTAGSKFYKLVDPNWVLHYPETQCKATVSGPLLVARGASDRAETCVDMVSCVKTNENGSCGAFGYCAAERNVFRFGGQQCQGSYDSCRTLASRQNKTVTYLTNTVDAGVCDATNVGCKWFSMLKTSSDSWKTWKWSSADTDKIYLNKNIEDKECSPNADGCSRFIRTKAGMATNLIPNPGFEIYEGGDSVLNGQTATEVKGWGQQKLTNDAYEGKAALLLDSGGALTIFASVPPAKFTRFFAVTTMGKGIGNNNGQTGLSLTVNSPFKLQKGNPFQAVAQDKWTELSWLYLVEGSSGQFNDTLNFSLTVKDAQIVIDALMLEEVDEPSLEVAHDYIDYAAENAVHLKKAPDYLKCYNATDPVPDGKPKTSAQIKSDDDVASADKLSGCDKYAKLCSAEEVGCEAYKPTDNGATMNGIAAYNDYCPKECAGYNTFSMSETYFEDSEFPKFLIPSTAKQCSAANAGCDEFTNLDALAAGGEAKEYYKELRHCAKLPDKQSSCSTYYTWEGSEVTGYQLQAHNLQKGTDGSPEIVNSAANAALCSKAIFDAKTNPDCRQFYDADGKVSYKLYSKTIFCSTDCHPYRRTLKYVNLIECAGRQGEWQSGECVFWAIPGQGAKCSAADNACREYRGNQAGIEFEVENYTFSNVDAANAMAELTASASALKTSPEYGQYLSVTSGGSEIHLATNSDKVIFEPTSEYNISFWIRNADGAANTNNELSVGLKDNISSNPTMVSDIGSANPKLSAEWKFYTFQITNDLLAGFSKSPILIISAGANFDIDNLKIVRTSDLQYLIKDSWKTQASCDKNLAGQPLAQAQIGCREFEDRDKNTHYLKSFSGLCAADKVGCEAVIDTENTLNPFEKEFSKDVIISSGLCNLNKTLQAKQDCVTAMENNCTTGGGAWDSTKNECVYAQKVFNNADSLMYLVNDEKKQCPAEEKGCTNIGLPSLTVDADGKYILKTKDNVEQWASQFYKLDPETYEAADSPLCQAIEQGCEEYKDKDGSTFFFKDPGDKTCEYRKVSVGSEMEYGWYKKKVNKDDLDVSCGVKGKGYYNDGNVQLLKADDLDYDGWVGACPGSANMCTAFVDPTDTALSENGKAYYYLNNENINKSECNTVSRKEGCVLFNDTSLNQKDLPYEAFSSYLDKKLVGTASLGNISCDPGTDYTFCLWMAECLQKTDNTASDCLTDIKSADANPSQSGVQYYCSGNANGNINAGCTAKQLMQKNANTVIKVVTDRQCGAWYSCKSSHWNWNENTGKFVEVCDEIGLCDTLVGEGDALECGNFINKENESNLLTQNQAMNKGYPARQTDWFSLDYSGLSVPYLAPAQFYNAFDLNAGEKTCGGGVGNTTCKKDDDCVNESVAYNKKCRQIELSDYRLVNQSDIECKTMADCAGKDFCKKTVNSVETNNCRCLNNVCVRPFNINGSIDPEELDHDKAGPAPECRGYPAKDAPFPSKNTAVAAYENVNKFYVENDTYSADDFGCNYKKVPYGGGQLYKYLPWSGEYAVSAPEGFCQDEPEETCGDDDCDENGKIGEMCTTTDKGNCGDGGTCLLKGSTDKKKGKIVEFRGWQGYCLETDASINKDNDPDQNPCLTWYPTYLLAGLQDLQNSYQTAGFYPTNYGFDTAGPYYCVKKARNEFRMAWLAKSIKELSGFCTNVFIPNITLKSGYKAQDPVTKKFFVVTDDNEQHLLDGTYAETKGIGEGTNNDVKNIVGDISEVYDKYKYSCYTEESPGKGNYYNFIDSPSEICSAGYLSSEYTPINLYDVDKEENTKAQIYFQCSPANSTDGKGWYYDDVGKITVLGDIEGLSGLDEESYEMDPKKHPDSAQTKWANAFAGQVHDTNWEIERDNCQEFYAVAEDNTGENKAYTNKVYLGLKNGIDGCQMDAKQKTGCNLFGALNLNKDAGYISSSLKNPLLQKDSKECDTYFGSETTYQFNPLDRWKGEGIFVGGNMCLGFTGGNQITDYFGKSYGYWKQDDTKVILSSDFKKYGKMDGISFINTNTNGKSPVVAGVIDAGKKDSSGNPLYAALPYKLTVGTAKGSQEEGIIEGSGGQLEVFVKFFAWAHDDQMPLRSVVIDWGDGPAVPQAGKFQNHKPRCQHETGEKLGLCQLKAVGIVGDTIQTYGNACSTSDECAIVKGEPGTCETDSFEDRFGDTSGQEAANACFEGYFQYKHTYTCAGEDSAGWDADKKACKFQIGVQVKDNWGWCNGDDGGSGFYESNCDPSSDKPYEYYDGMIYVKP